MLHIGRESIYISLIYRQMCLSMTSFTSITKMKINLPPSYMLSDHLLSVQKKISSSGEITQHLVT